MERANSFPSTDWRRGAARRVSFARRAAADGKRTFFEALA
jgi:hypothetical protein